MVRAMYKCKWESGVHDSYLADCFSLRGGHQVEWI